ncbi:MAG: sulfotransferase family 2 domain-containing protein, partial [Gammaproteobacteria bacterium]|nr:sulfotransferase family 2 domain-containing protein [Gammaproteobacteria bacterium]
RRLSCLILDGIPVPLHWWIRQRFLLPRYRRMLARGDDRFCLCSYREHRAIFVHIPKTGGISVSTSLFERESPHFCAADYRAIFGPTFFDQCFKFCIVRNPWDRLYSAYSFLKRGGMNQRDRYWAQRNLGDCDSFERFVLDWLTPESLRRCIHLLPQADFVTDGEGRLLVDFVGRLETFGVDFQTIRERLGRPRAELLHLNRSERRDYREIYDEAMRERVAELYARDVDLFGYRF